MKKIEKHEKMNFFTKMEKNDEKKKNEEIWIHAQNPRRFPEFTVVVVTFFVTILDDFHDFFSECASLSRGKSTTRFAGSAFFKRKVTIFIGRETKTHILPTKSNEQNSVMSALLSIIILLE